MKPYSEMTKEELLELKRDLSDQYREFQGKNLTLDMSRGKPSAEQLDLSMGMMDVLSSDSDLTCEDGTDCRNYGGLDGISEAKELLADMIEVPADNIIIYGKLQPERNVRHHLPFYDSWRYGKYPVVQA